MDKILESIKDAEHILLNCHAGTDADSVGSSLAMHFYLKSLGKKVTHFSGDADIPEYLKKLPNAKWIENRNWFELDLKKFGFVEDRQKGSIKSCLTQKLKLEL